MVPLTEPTDVMAWAPDIRLASGVGETARVAAFAAAVRAGYHATPPSFTAPEELLVTGRHFAVVSAAAGLVPASVHTLPRFGLRQALAPVAGFDFADMPMLVAASAGHGNYYHWLAETLATAIAWRQLMPHDPVPLLVPPPRERWQRDSLLLLAAGQPLHELAPDRALVLTAGRRASLTGPEVGRTPHPGLLAAMARAGAGAAAATTPARCVYLARLDAGDRRRMANETALCTALAAAGCAIVVPGTLPVAEQIALVRGALLIVAPHGAALANLLFVEAGESGPTVIELFSEAYLNRCFAKLAQAKALRYHAVVNRCLEPGVHHHVATWEADIPAVLALVAAS